MENMDSHKQLGLDNVARQLGRLDAAEMALRKAVADARRNGASWADVGLVLGVSRQAAQQRFGA